MTEPPARPAQLRGVLDTSTVIQLSRLTETSSLPERPVITTVTLAELSAGPLLARDERERAARQAVLRRSGRTVTARSYDAMIAATALSQDLAVHTCNPTDFAGIEGLRVVAVPHPG